MFPCAGLRLLGKRLAEKAGLDTQCHHAQYLCHDIRVSAVESAQGWHMKLDVLYQGQCVALHEESGRLYLDFAHARIAGLLIAYELVDKMQGKTPAE